MKKIYSIALSALALLAFLPAVKAQEPAEGIEYSKTISKPDENGVYTITLESYVTGSVEVKSEPIPADIVLVLDLSTSMSASRGEKSVVSSQTLLSYNDVVNSETNYLYKYVSSWGWQTQENYYQLSGLKYGDNYYLYFVQPGTGYRFLKSDGSRCGSVDSLTPPSDAAFSSSASETFVTFAANDDLYTGSSRIKDLQNAVCDFIDYVNDNDLYKNGDDGKPDKTKPRDTRLGNAISIITFSGENLSKVDFEFAKLADDNIAELKSIVRGFTLAQGTRPGEAMIKANNQFATWIAKEENKNRESFRTAIMFTDGEPNDNYAAIAQALTTKSSYQAKVFTIGLFDNSPTGDNLKYMQYTSSNYPNASGINSPGTGGDPGAGYYQDASQGQDLSEIFSAIGQQATGGSDIDLDEETITEVDVVSASFKLPPGADETSIKVYTSMVLGAEEDGTLIFGTRDPETGAEVVDGKWAVPNNPYTYDKYEKDAQGHRILVEEDVPVDDNIGVELKISGIVPGKKDMIEVTGFDYGNNFCGTEEDSEGHVTYRGYKVIIEIPIMMDDSAVGGPHVDTNAPGSGIYVGGKNIAPFVSPKVSLPINLHINKQGLKEGESAMFTIERAKLPAVGWTKPATSTDPAYDNLEWEDVTTVFVTRREGQLQDKPITKVNGLPSTSDDNKEYVYRIKETKWSWSYSTLAPLAITSDHLVTNPFIFTNTKIEGAEQQIRHAESKVTNTFRDESKWKEEAKRKNKEYDDSKDNGRGSK